MKFEPKATSTTYQIEIDPEAFNIIEVWEWNCNTGVNTLAQVLEKHSSACDVDYNGHFGINIFLSLETENDSPAEWDNIQYIIKEWVENAEKLCKQNNISID